ncbi:MAG TPA: imidazolonepropionase [Acetobacteraceae bacterium]|nr:imidazolonepropionase [Acetobacteraceae bacterium]
MHADAIWQGGLIATMAAGGAPYGAMEDAALAVRAGRIAWIGPAAALPSDLRGPATETHDFTGQILTPGLIDCHTHLVFAGDRSAEFEARLGGISYEEAAKSGRGIISTVAATRAASEQSLIDTAAKRLGRLMAEGVTTIEIKSGYGLTRADELKMLRAARALGMREKIRVRTTLLAAHATPPEFANDPGSYIDKIVTEILPEAALSGLADAVDGFLETIAFTPAQIDRVFSTARALGLPVKLHADQLSDGGGAELAARHLALSADHLEYTSERGVRAMAAAGTIAVLLPGAYLTVGATQPPPVAAFRRHAVPMAVATDANPGSSPLASLLTAMNLACCLFRLTPEESLAGATRIAAAALGLQQDLGTLEAGKIADFVQWPVRHPRELAYWMGGLIPTEVHRAGM